MNNPLTKDESLAAAIADIGVSVDPLRALQARLDEMAAEDDAAYAAERAEAAAILDELADDDRTDARGRYSNNRITGRW